MCLHVSSAKCQHACFHGKSLTTLRTVHSGGVAYSLIDITLFKVFELCGARVLITW